MNSDVLNSWKEVASYLGRGVRTVQRWEQELSLPVRRPRGKSRSAIIAFRSELDEWLQRASRNHLAIEEHDLPPAVNGVDLPPAANGRHRQLHERTVLLLGRTRQLLDRSTALCQRMQDMGIQVTRTVELATVKAKRNAENNGVEFVKSPPGSASAELITAVPAGAARENGD